MNVIELMDEISKRSPSLLDKTLKGLYEGSLKSVAQENDKATFTKKLKKEDKKIDWMEPAQKLHNKIRGMYKINTPHTIFKDKIVKILKTEVVEANAGQAGEILEVSKLGIIVKCKENALKLLLIKPEGKGEMRAFDWANGARIKKGDCFQ